MKQRGLGLVVLVVGSCAYTPPSISTLPQRREVLAPQISDSLTGTMNCPNAQLTFVSTESSTSAAFPSYRDLYVAEGCGQRTEFATSVSMLGTIIEKAWASPVPAIEGFRAEAHAQADKTAAFDFECKDLSHVDLTEQLGMTHDSFQASIGESGCGKHATYHTHCNATGYTAGTHQISCTSKQDIATAETN